MTKKTKPGAQKSPQRSNPSSYARWKTKEVIIPILIAVITVAGTIIAAIIGSPLLDSIFPKADDSESTPQPRITPFPNRSGDKIFFLRNDDYYMMSRDGSYEIRIVSNPEGFLLCPSISYDGEKLVFTSNIEGHTDIYTINRDGSNLRNVSNGISFDEVCASWRPGQKQILFYRQYSTTSDILMIDADGKNEINVTNSYIGYSGSMNSITETAWSPDGKKFVFQSDRDGNYNIFIYDFTSTETHRVTDGDQDEYKATWSPDGTKIAFTSAVYGSDTDIFIAEVSDFSKLPVLAHNITNHPAHDTDPSWSPDGQQIIFVSDRDKNGDIFIMDSDGANVEKLTNTPEYENRPRWIK